MDINGLLNEIKIEENLLSNHEILFQKIKNDSDWNTEIKARKTVSYGVPYNYSNISYPFIEFPDYISETASLVEERLSFSINNCLINYYENGESKMGFHSDQVDILADNTGVAIVSLGNKRIIRFKSKLDPYSILDISLYPNSLFYMTQSVQEFWLHSILPETGNNAAERISITFRKLIS
ncbi:alpha-ketoglutarate-dependent dioxygenase AlkB [Flavobacterium ginsenosidimutans]|uniref:alpha-ketoglutarate-dependent dioxygenase AlkB n=1 Tax=Flavobacterium ginsenosidimutans TaxID=687844 RepID=UPI000DAC73EB|nr:alpha-ketoglutarate-dependent dioxygenase AlkB [Flavobacterium ginsenosidimutans]KAF2332395.1 alpha-ketoglutarate-dependent dioxygenase AlkB [Flavobacterium ginsenosidimutans]